jgi:hypothetical protein
LLCGVNPSTADATINDQTIRKEMGFISCWGGGKLLKVNAFAFRATDIRKLATADDPVGRENDTYLRRAIAKADVLIPCWGSATKLPPKLRGRLQEVAAMMRNSGKPLKIFGLTQSGDPLHPLMLSYDTPLVDWQGY